MIEQQATVDPEASVGERLLDALHRKIINGDVPVGTWLRHEALAEEFGVSRTPVREALRVLHAQGVVTIVPHRGARVNGHSATDVRQLAAVRAELMGLAAELAAEHIDDTRLDRLHAALQDIRWAWQTYEDNRRTGTSPDPDRPRLVAVWMSSITEFHAVVVDAAENRQLALTIAELQRRLPHNLYNRAYAGNSRLVKKVVNEHAEIAQAITDHDPSRARRLMAGHVRSSFEVLARWIEHERP
ncbi:MAG: GntR family transcriptional regulator [Actinomycetes bacterium]